jgi:flagellar biosynthesis component FlhA
VPTVSTLVLFAMLLGLLVWAKNKKNNIEEKDGIAKKKKEEKSNGDEKESKSKKSDKKG